MNKKNITCCFTGHRQIPSTDYPIIKEQLEDTITMLINNYGVKYFGVGGALGFDTLVAKTILNIKKYSPDIKMILVLPCKNQTDRWNEYDKIVYENIKKQADKIVYIEEQYTDDCMLKRNRHLVNNSEFCVCYMTRNYGGTAYTYSYAKRRGLKIYNLADMI